MVVLAVFAKRTLLFLSDGATLNGEERTEVPECRTLHVSSSQRRLGSAWFCTSCLARILKQLVERERETGTRVAALFGFHRKHIPGNDGKQENLLRFDTDIVGFLEFLNDIERRFRFLIPVE